MHLLRNGTKHYDWGSVDAIPQFTGDRRDGNPVAEVWIGTHPLSPSAALGPDGSEKPLSDIAGDLPFMVKLLAAERPLSLQVHPSLAQAAAGYAAEEESGVPLDAPHRVYKDPNHKPEMVYALTTFDSLIGFRPSAEIVRVMGPLNTPLSNRIAEELRAKTGFATIVRVIEMLLNEDIPPVEIHQIVGACRTLSAMSLDIKRAYQTAIEIAEHYPDDIGVVISLMLNRMTLQPGEAAYLETGVIHAHLKGLCIEVMASSDNVLRAGLTSKHIDTAGLVACLESGMARVARVTPDFLEYDTELFAPAGGGFALAVTQVSTDARAGVSLVAGEGSVLVCTGGEVTVANQAGESVTLGRGESLYLSPEDQGVTARGLGEVAQAYVPESQALTSRLVEAVPSWRDPSRSTRSEQ